MPFIVPSAVLATCLLGAGTPAFGAAPRPLPASVQEYLTNAEFGGQFALADLVRSSVHRGQLRVEFALSDDLIRQAEKAAAATRPVRVRIKGSDLAWSVKSYGETGPRRTVALACYDVDALAPFQCVALHVGPDLIKIYAAGFDRPGIQPRLELTQTSEGIAFSWMLPNQEAVSGRADTLEELRKRYPAFVQKTLAPVMARVGVRGFSRRHPAVEVYRAFPDVRPDGPVAKQVDDLIVRLGSAKPREREAASAELEQLGRPGVLAVLRTDRTDLSPEQNARLDRFLVSSGEANMAATQPPVHDIDFLIDCLDDDDPGVRKAAKAGLEQALGKPLDFDTSLTGDARAEAVDHLYEQLDPLLRPEPATKAGKQ